MKYLLRLCKYVRISLCYRALCYRTVMYAYRVGIGNCGSLKFAGKLVCDNFPACGPSIHRQSAQKILTPPSVLSRYLQSLLNIPYPEERCRGQCTREHSTSRLDSAGQSFLIRFRHIGQDRQWKTTVETNAAKSPTRNIQP